MRSTPLKHMTILIVEDDQDVLSTTARVLEKQGAVVSTASSARDGIEKAERLLPDLILLDVVLPGSDGRTLCRRFKGNPDLEHTAIVLISGLKTDADTIATGLIDSEADEYILRPIGNRELVARLSVVIRLKTTQKKLAETNRELTRRESEIQSILDNSPVCVVLVDKKTRTISYVNQKAASLSGYSGKDLLGTVCNQVICPAETSKCPILDLGEDLDHSERLLKTSDGREIPILKSASQVSYHGRPHLIEQFVDIREQKAALITALENENRFRLAFENANEGMCLVDTRGTLMQTNQRMCEMFGYSRQELEAMTVNDIAHPEDKTLSSGAIHKILSGEETHAVFEKRYVHKHGHTITASVSTALVRDSDNQPQYFISHIKDITAQKNREKNRRKYERQLRQSQKLEAIGALAGGIAHDFNNILSAVIGYGELAMGRAEKGTPLADDLSEILTAGNRAKDLIKQILTFSREKEMAKNPVRLAMIVKECAKLLRSSIPATIDMITDLNSDAAVMGDAAQFHQIVMNLCTNASQAMKRTGGQLTITLKDVLLDKEFAATHPDLSPGPHVLLSIQDSGSGIPPDIIDHIFVPFFTTREKEEGTGLGLSVVHGIVKDFKGEILVYSEMGKGTVFKIYFPAVKKTPSHESVVPVSIPAGSERILLVDDEPSIVKMGKQVLESLGYHVTVRTNGIEALELFKARKDDFDLIISDMTMPKMDGEALVREIKKITAQIPIILCTGFNPNMDEDRAAALGISALAHKPFSKHELGMTIRRILDQGTQKK